jgi:hypothetical protein
MINMKDRGKIVLSLLDTLLDDSAKDTIYPCIRDLVEHGIDPARFSAGEIMPQRQDITQYVAAWSRHAGLSEEQSRGWLIDYCVAMGASLSKRSPAAIRHSTESNLRYIYRSAVPFLCECANNRFRAHCSSACPVYANMQEKLRVKASEALAPKSFAPPQALLIEPVLPVKQVYLEQFQTGLRLVRDEVQQGTKMRRIVEILNERGLKTRTGRKWQLGILRNELQNLKTPHVPPQDGRESGGLPECPAGEQDASPNDGPATPGANSKVVEGPSSVS